MIQILRAAARSTQATSLFRSAIVQKQWGPLSNSVAACRLDLYLPSRNFSGLGCEVKQWGLSTSIATKGGNIHSTPAPFRIQCRNKSRVRFEYAPKERRNRQDHYRRLLAAKYELDRRLYKALWKNENLPEHIREDARLKLRKLPRNSSFTRIRNRCILTGRPRAVYRKFRMSRLCFRELAREGALLGIRKASW